MFCNIMEDQKNHKFKVRKEISTYWNLVMSPTWRCASHQLIVFLKQATFETHFPSMFDFYSKELYVQMYASACTCYVPYIIE